MFQGCLPPILSEKKSDAVSHNLQTTAVSHSPVLALQTVPAQDPAQDVVTFDDSPVLIFAWMKAFIRKDSLFIFL